MVLHLQLINFTLVIKELNEATENIVWDNSHEVAILPPPGDSTPGNNGISYSGNQYWVWLPDEDEVSLLSSSLMITVRPTTTALVPEYM